MLVVPCAVEVTPVLRCSADSMYVDVEAMAPVDVVSSMSSSSSLSFSSMRDAVDGTAGKRTFLLI